MSKKFAVLGSPISHSKSPAIHLAAYRVLGNDWEYGRAEVLRGGLRKFIDELEPGWSGFSVTMPLKEDATRFADELDNSAKVTGATNTLFQNEFGKWIGFNTDVFGIVSALKNAGVSSVHHALILGSGATAVSAAAALALHSPGAKVKVYARNQHTAKKLVAFAKERGLKASIAKNLARASKKAQITISALPAHALDDEAKSLAAARLWKPGGVLLDVAYNPWPSELASAWSSREIQVISGIEMLIWQAVAQVRIFRTGDPSGELPNEIAVVEAMRIASE
jgi:shikimate dehydrogenase